VARTRSVTTGVLITAVAVLGGGAFAVNQNDDTADGPTPAAVAASPEATTTASPSAAPTQSDSPSPTPTPSPTAEALMVAGDSGDTVRELQHRLKQLEWYAPDVTGEFDETTVTAVTGFQEKRGLTGTGDVDEKTWEQLVEMSREPTEDEKHNRLTPGPTIIGPDDTGDDVRELQARLKQIGWFSADVTPNYGDATVTAVTGFQEKREIPDTGEVDQRTWDRLTEMTDQPTEDELHNREPDSDEDSDDSGADEDGDEDGGDGWRDDEDNNEDDNKDDEGDDADEDGSSDEKDNEESNGLDPRCNTGRALCIDKSTASMSWVVGGEVKSTMEVRFGSELTPTREGAFSVSFKSRDHVSSLYDTPMPYAMFFSGGQAVHYSPDFAANGYNGASHGCVNVRDEGGIASLFDKVSVGDKVIVYRS